MSTPVYFVALSLNTCHVSHTCMTSATHHNFFLFQNAWARWLFMSELELKHKTDEQINPVSSLEP